MNDELIILVVRLAFGSIAAFTAILLWARTRDTAWLFIILAAVLSYGVVIFDALDFFGALSALPLGAVGRTIGEAIFRGSPYLFLGLGFMIAVKRRS